MTVKNPVMKTILTIQLMLMSISMYSQDWILFPHQTNMYYLPVGTTALFNCNQDSTSTDGTETNYYFNIKAPNGVTQACFESVMNFDDDGYYDWPPFDMHLKGNGDSLTHYNNNFGTMPAIFKPNAAVGTSWTISNNSAESDISSIEITCDSITLGSVLGIPDSLKYYSVHTTSPITGDYTIDKATFVLSKHYGMVRFLPFHQLINPTTCTDCFRCYDLIGWHSDISAAGYEGPLWDDWIHLAPGDFLKYYHYTSAPLGIYSGYSTALIQNVTHFNDSIVIEYESNYGYALQYTYYKNAINNAINSPSWRSFYLPESANDSVIGRNVGRLFPDETGIDTITFPGVWRYKQSMRYIGTQYEPDCMVYPAFEYGQETDWDSYIGVTFESQGDPESYSYSALVGYIINGQTFGDYSPLGIDEQITQHPLHIFPNPVNTILNCQETTNQETQYFIYDITGKCCLSISSSSGSLSVTDLPAGTYIIEAISDTKYQSGKFVKI